MQSTRITLALAAMAVAMAGCAAHDRGYADNARGPGSVQPVASPAMSPDRQGYEPIRSFSDPGPNYPDTGR